MTRKTILLLMLLVSCLLLASCSGGQPAPEPTPNPQAEIFKEAKKYGIRKNGKMIADPIWDYIEEYPCAGGMVYRVSYRNKDGLMDESGNLLVQPEYSHIEKVRGYDFAVLEPEGKYDDPAYYQCPIYDLNAQKTVDTLPGRMLSSGGQSEGRFISWYGRPKTNHHYPLGVYDIITRKSLGSPVDCRSMLNVSSELLGDFGLVLNYHAEIGRSKYQYFSTLFTTSGKCFTKAGSTFSHEPNNPLFEPSDYDTCDFLLPGDGKLLLVQTEPDDETYEYYRLPELTRLGTEAYSICTPFTASDGSVRAIASSGEKTGDWYYGQVYLLNLTEGTAAKIDGAVRGMDFSDGLAAVQDASERWGCIDENGKFVYGFLFDEAPVFRNGHATTVYQYKKVTLDKEGNIQ